MKCTICKTPTDYIKCEKCGKTFCDQIECHLKNNCDECGNITIYESEVVEKIDDSGISTNNPNYTQDSLSDNDSETISTPSSCNMQMFFKVIFYALLIFMQLVVVLDAFVAKANYIDLLKEHALLISQYNKIKGESFLSSFFLPNTINLNI